MVLKKMKKRFAALSLSKGFINVGQAIEALTIQVKENIKEKKYRPIGDILLDLGYMDKQEIEEVLESKFEQRFGDAAIAKGFITLNHLVKAMAIQVKEEAEEEKHRLIGEILIDIGHVSKSQVLEVLDAM